jgi:asparagine synthase (glutamine-hydrolysing)
MCGIAGVALRDPHEGVRAETIDRMRDAMTHRGPDDCGTFVGPGVGLGSRRLSIVDLSERGHMPMTSPDGRYHIVYNGEVYNYRELRSGLPGSEPPFVSNTDTEVLLRLYAREGPAMLPRLNGMFAIAIWDAAERTLFLARDRLGIKPLYYASQRGDLLFASEPKGLFAAGVSPSFDPATWEELLCFRYVAGEATPLAGVRRLLPGHFMVWRSGESRTERWWNLADRVRAARDTPARDVAGWYRETLDSAVAYRRISDVPLGVLLSGGLDSSSVASLLARQAGRGVASFTIRFPGTDQDEGPKARRLAEAWGLEHHELSVAPETLIGELSFASWLNDEPLVHGSDIHLLAISRYAKPRVTVLLSGEGADETLGGYLRYRPLRFPRLLTAGRALLESPGAARLLGHRTEKLRRLMREGSAERWALFGACDVLPGDLAALGAAASGRFPFRERVLAEAVALYPGEPVRQAMYSDQHTFLCSILDLNDRMTMGASIECRVPFLDYRLVEGLAALPTGSLMGAVTGKRLLRRALSEELKPVLAGYRKWGFTAPWGRYLREVPALRATLQALPESDPVRDGFVTREPLRASIAAFLAGDDAPEPLLRELLLVQAWHRAVVDRGEARRAAPA